MLKNEENALTSRDHILTTDTSLEKNEPIMELSENSVHENTPSYELDLRPEGVMVH